MSLNRTTTAGAGTEASDRAFREGEDR